MESPIYFEERWTPITEKSVPGVVENAYAISDRGRVYSYLRNVYLNPTESGNGYYRVCLRLKNGNSRYYLIHRILMIEFKFIDNYQNMQVNHFNGNKGNNNIWNLEWVTASENIYYAYRTGLKTQHKGEECSFATITNEQAEQIAQMILSDKYSYQEIANIIGCTKSVVSDIATGSTWKNIHKKYNLEAHKKKFVLRLSDYDLERLCKYWEDHRFNQYQNRVELYKDSLLNALGIEYSDNMSATLSRLYNGISRRDITSKYNFRIDG